MDMTKHIKLNRHVSIFSWVDAIFRRSTIFNWYGIYFIYLHESSFVTRKLRGGRNNMFRINLMNILIVNAITTLHWIYYDIIYYTLLHRSPQIPNVLFDILLNL